jgi:hypothetical protein
MAYIASIDLISNTRVTGAVRNRPIRMAVLDRADPSTQFDFF